LRTLRKVMEKFGKNFIYRKGDNKIELWWPKNWKKVNVVSWKGRKWEDK
jgi:hypothetical protein